MTNREYESVLSEEALSRTRGALNKGPVFGFHMYYGGGRGGAPFVFTDFSEFVKNVSLARAGDIFLIWSTAELESGNGYLEKAQDSRLKVAGWTERMLEQVSAYLRGRFHEVFIIYGSDEGRLQSLLVDADGLDDLRAIAAAAEHSGLVGVYPFTDIDQDGFYLLKAKRPDADGLVPQGGAY